MVQGMRPSAGRTITRLPFPHRSTTEGRASPCLFKHAASGSMVFIHGDDFVVSGPETHLKELKKAICDKYKAKVRATLGPEITDDKSVVMLCRIIEWKDTVWTSRLT